MLQTCCFYWFNVAIETISQNFDESRVAFDQLLIYLRIIDLLLASWKSIIHDYWCDLREVWAQIDDSAEWVHFLSLQWVLVHTVSTQYFKVNGQILYIESISTWTLNLLIVLLSLSCRLLYLLNKIGLYLPQFLNSLNELPRSNQRLRCHNFKFKIFIQSILVQKQIVQVQQRH